MNTYRSNKVPDYTPLQSKFMELLRDGKPHTKQELFNCLDDPEPSPNSLRVHMTYLRKKLRPQSLDVLASVGSGVTYYRLVRVLAYEE